VSGHRWPIVFGIVGAVASGPALAQDFTQGKTPAQLFAGDCAACHKSPQGLAKGSDPRSIASFLREHYTTKPEMAEALAAYVVSSGGSARGQSAPSDSSGPKSGKGAASNDAGRSSDGARPRAAIPTSDDGKPADAGEGKPAGKPRPVANAPDGDPPKQSGRPRAATVSDAPKPADDKPAADAKRGGEDDAAAADGSKPKPKAARADDGKKPADSLVPVTTGKLNSYARAGSSDKDKVTESAEVRANKLRSYATSGEAAPTTVSAPPKAVASPPPEERATTPDSGETAKVTPTDPKPAADDAPKVEPNDSAKPAADETPKPEKPRKLGAADGGKSQDGTASKPRRTDANAQQSSPMSFFGRIFSGGARREGDSHD